MTSPEIFIRASPRTSVLTKNASGNPTWKDTMISDIIVSSRVGLPDA